MPLSAQSRLVLIRVKIVRARKHLQELREQADRLFGQSLHVIGTRIDSVTGKSEQYFGPIPIAEFNVLATAGDVIQNLRSALDHLACQLVEIGSGNDKGHDVGFPIAKNEAKYRLLRDRKLNGARGDAIEAVNALKPYSGGNEPLWVLHKLNNLDKHRLLLTVAGDQLFIGEGAEGGFWLKARNPIFDGIVGDGPNSLVPTLEALVPLIDNIIGSFEPHLNP